LATEFTLRRPDGRPLGTFGEVQATVRRLCYGVEFFWTTSGPEKVKEAAANGVELPDAIRQWMETLPSLLEGVVEADDYRIEFGLGNEEPVPFLSVTPRGSGPRLQEVLSALEAEYGDELRIAGSDPALAKYFTVPFPPPFPQPGDEGGG
jgi:hypothetical protein